MHSHVDIIMTFHIESTPPSRRLPFDVDMVITRSWRARFFVGKIPASSSEKILVLLSGRLVTFSAHT
jgi:hypothetical protein